VGQNCDFCCTPTELLLLVSVYRREEEPEPSTLDDDGTFGVIQGTFGAIQGTFRVIQGTFGVI
jgi:hypothetical protein